VGIPYLNRPSSQPEAMRFPLGTRRRRLKIWLLLEGKKGTTGDGMKDMHYRIGSTGGKRGPSGDQATSLACRCHDRHRSIRQYWSPRSVRGCHCTRQQDVGPSGDQDRPKFATLSLQVAMSLPVYASHICRTPSYPQEATRVLSGDQATAKTPFL